jgi:hypothetical protein
MLEDDSSDLAVRREEEVLLWDIRETKLKLTNFLQLTLPKDLTKIECHQVKVVLML